MKELGEKVGSTREKLLMSDPCSPQIFLPSLIGEAKENRLGTGVADSSALANQRWRLPDTQNPCSAAVPYLAEASCRASARYV